MSNDAKTFDADPVAVEIIRGTLVAITDEMKTNLMRTAYNPIIYEALDYTVGLFDRRGQTLSIGLGLPMFIRGLSDAVMAKIEHYGYDGIEPDDILLTNDPYTMGSHLNHMVFTKPIFWEGEIVGFASSMAHWQDIGGVLSGVTRDVYSEGLQMPIVKMFKRGVQDQELTDIIRANVRLPELALGDMRAQIASINTGEARYLELLERHGVHTVAAAIESLYQQSEIKARRAVEAFPDGVYEAESFLDDDGVSDQQIPIKVRVEIDGDRMIIDLTEVSPQVSGYFNSGATSGRSAAQVAFKCLTTALDLPINDGAFRPLEIRLAPGRVVSAVKPAAVRWWMTIPMTIVDTIFRALASAIPEGVAAGHHADLCILIVFGVDPRTGRFFSGPTSLPGGGWGAKHNEDGMSATVCINDGDTHNTPVEAMEVKMPIVVERYALRQDSGGPGEYRGGLGTEQQVRMLGETGVDIHMERTQCAPWGLAGGTDGFANRLQLARHAGGTDALPTGKYEGTLPSGDSTLIESGGGGGFGDPTARPAEKVAHDVRMGYVSRAAAATDYGVILDDALQIDQDATDLARAR